MANGITTAFWGMVINNYDDNDLVIIRTGYPDHCRELIHTLEQGENGTPHIQAWLKLQRQQRLSFVKKLFPRANFKPLTSDEYVANAKAYAQKQDTTARSPAIHTFHDPMITLESVMRQLVADVIQDTSEKDYMDERCPEQCWDRATYHLDSIKRQMVRDDFRHAKQFVSATFKTIWKEYGREVFQCIHRKYWEKIDAHTHTHTQAENIVAEVYIPTTEDEQDQDEDGFQSEDEEQGIYEDEDEGSTFESSDGSSSEEDSGSDGGD